MFVKWDIRNSLFLLNVVKNELKEAADPNNHVLKDTAIDKSSRKVFIIDKKHAAMINHDLVSIRF